MRSPSPRYTYVGFLAVSLLDAGKSWSYEAAMEAADAGNVLGSLEAEFGIDFDIGLYTAEDRVAIEDAFNGMAGVVDSRRKFGVENSGLALVAAWCLQMVQTELAEQ